MANPPIVKVCGLNQQKNAETLSQLPIDLMGFIFYDESVRSATKKDLPWISRIPKKKVAVVVNKDLSEVFDLVQEGLFDLVQLHGNESPEYCAQLREQIPVYKAISIQKELPVLSQYMGSIDSFIFDTKHPVHRGGSGLQFNWALLSDYQEEIPFLLSGGISLEDVQRIQTFSHLQYKGVDINSKFEISPGIKHIDSVQSFIQQILK